MNKISITKKDIEQITEACVKNRLKEDFYQNHIDLVQGFSLLSAGGHRFPAAPRWCWASAPRLAL